MGWSMLLWVLVVVVVCGGGTSGVCSGEGSGGEACASGETDGWDGGGAGAPEGGDCPELEPEEEVLCRRRSPAPRLRGRGRDGAISSIFVSCAASDGSVDCVPCIVDLHGELAALAASSASVRSWREGTEGKSLAASGKGGAGEGSLSDVKDGSRGGGGGGGGGGGCGGGVVVRSSADAVAVCSVAQSKRRFGTWMLYFSFIAWSRASAASAAGSGPFDPLAACAAGMAAVMCASEAGSWPRAEGASPGMRCASDDGGGGGGGGGGRPGAGALGCHRRAARRAARAAASWPTFPTGTSGEPGTWFSLTEAARAAARVCRLPGECPPFSSSGRLPAAPPRRRVVMLVGVGSCGVAIVGDGPDDIFQRNTGLGSS